MKRPLHLLTCIYLTLALFFAVPFSIAQDSELISEESFILESGGGPYTLGDLPDQGPANYPGFKGPWIGQVFSGSIYVIEEGLDYIDADGAALMTAGGAVEVIHGAAGRLEFDNSPGGPYSEYSIFGSIGLAQTGTLYFSHILNHNPLIGPADEFGAPIITFELGNGGDNAVLQILTTPVFSEEYTGMEGYLMRPNRIWEDSQNFAPFLPNQSNLFVVKVEFVAGEDNDIVSVFLNPNLSSEEANVPDLVYAEQDYTFNQLRMGAFNGLDESTLVFDEIRFGKTWESVTPHQGGGQPSEWAGYPVDENGDVNTEAFLGWIRVYQGSGWIYSYSLANFIYLPESNVKESGAWAFTLR